MSIEEKQAEWVAQKENQAREKANTALVEYRTEHERRVEQQLQKVQQSFQDAKAVFAAARARRTK